MALPKLDIPIYEVIIPSTEKKIKYRPFLSKEEKILLMALKGEDVDEIVNASKQVVNNCILEKDFDIDTLTLYDLEYLMLHLRMKSQSDEISLRFQGHKNSACEECKKERLVKVDLNDAKIERNKNHEHKIILDEKQGIGLIMKDPTVNLLNHFEKAKSSESVDDYLKAIWKCVDVVFDAEATHSTKDVSDAEAIEFLENLTQKQMGMIEQFFVTMPALRLKIEFKCKKCSKVTKDSIEGLQSFFP